MQALVTNLRPQDHTQTYGEYCLDTALTPEYRDLIVTAGFDWLVSQWRRLRYSETLSADVITTAIAQHVDTSAEHDAGEFYARIEWLDSNGG